MAKIIARKKYILISLAVMLANLLLDRFTKIWARKVLRGGARFSLFDNTLVLLYSENTGAFLSFGSDWGSGAKYIVFIIIPLLICAAALFALFFKEKNLYRVITISAVIGGGAGNLIDRALNNFRVIDFLNFGIGGFRTGILNTADLSVTFGALALIVLELRRPARGACFTS